MSFDVRGLFIVNFTSVLVLRLVPPPPLPRSLNFQRGQGFSERGRATSESLFRNLLELTD